MFGFCSSGGRSGEAVGRSVTASAYITKLKFTVEQIQKGLWRVPIFFQTMTCLDKNTNTMLLCSLYYNSDSFYILNITPYYNTKYNLSSYIYTLPTFSQLRITMFYSGEDEPVGHLPLGLELIAERDNPELTKKRPLEKRCY